MNFEQYSNQRSALMDELKALIESGDLENAEAKKKEIEELDAKWDKITAAMADALALEQKAPKAPNFKAMEPAADMTAKPIDKTSNMPNGKTDLATLDMKDAYKAPEYVNAWAKKMMGKPLDDYEAQLYKMVDDYTHTTDNTGVVIPETVAQGIWQEVEEMYPYFADITKTYVSGLMTIIQSKTFTDAAWYDEATATEDGQETFATVTLSGCELARNIKVSWKLKEMSIEDFIPYIQRRIAERMGAGAGYGVTYGLGPTAEKPEPTGVVTALKADGTQVVEYSGTVTYDNIAAARGNIKSGYAAGLAIYANSYTIWNVLAKIEDANGRPIFIPDPTGSGVFRIFGMPVKEDGSFTDGDILISNASQGYQANVAKQIGVLSQDDVTNRITTYAGYAIMDGNILTLAAHSLLTAGSGSDSTEAG